METPTRIDVERMPGYPFFVAVIFWGFGGSIMAVSMVQIVLDSISCVLVYLLAEMVQKGSGILSGILASLNIGMITYSLFILNDSIFLLFFILILIITVQFFRKPQWKNAFLLGAAIGIATMIRPVSLYLPFFLTPLLFARFTVGLRLPFLMSLQKSVLMLIIFMFILAPWFARNYFHYGRFQLSAQSGEHLLQYIVPFTWQYSKGIPFIQGMKKANEAFDKKGELMGWNTHNMNPFEKSDHQVKMAIGYLRQEPKTAILKAWFFGIVKNLFSPAIIDLSSLLNIERPHFFYTEGKTALERAWNFVKGMKGWFGWAMIGSMIALALCRILQAWGLLWMMKNKLWESLFLILIIGYFLLISGPVGYAKYRLPFEPILIIFMAIGIKDLYGRVIRYKV
ncbi:ArnT family glycosyltransferase [Thermodesulfobacteriota bacterium]